jgi:hypothetical protein
MIVVKQKDIDWMLERLRGAGRVVVLGCGSCATVCFGGGEREVEELCCSLQLVLQETNDEVEFRGLTCKRVCDWEFVEPVEDILRGADIVLSLACGAGHNLLAEHLPGVRVLPGTDTVLLGTNTAPGEWQEMCAACGECIIDLTFGFCPVARCAKTLMNGPCGGSSEGKCEVNPQVECVWDRIVERARELGRLEELEVYIPPRDWSHGRHGGQRSLERSDLGLSRLCAERLDEV